MDLLVFLVYLAYVENIIMVYIPSIVGEAKQKLE
jgi:hypothetical protein